METFLTWLLRPFVALSFFVLAWLVAALVHKYMPDGRLKRLLFAPLPGHKRRWP
jgi:hypothetical protein